MTAPALAAMSLAGCKLIEETTKKPVQAVMAILPGGKSIQLDPAALQIELQRYADDFASRTLAALEEYVQRAGTDEARTNALRWKFAVSSSAISIASGPNPIVNLIDFLALATLTCTLLEEDLVKTSDGAAFQPWLETGRALETDAWNMAQGILPPEQQEELRACIRDWLGSNTGVRRGFFSRPQTFSAVVRQAAKKKTQNTGGLFSLVGLDPTAGLDPAVREVTRTRLFAERALFVAQRMPFLVHLQVELMTDQLLHAADQEGKLRGLAAEVGHTLAAGEKMSTALNTTLITFEALMKRFGAGEPKTDAAPNPDSKPFDILDYARTAEQLAVTARELDVLLKDAGSTLDSPALSQRLEDATAGARSLLNHAFLLGAGLVLLAFACTLAYRRLTPRDSRSSPGAPR